MKKSRSCCRSRAGGGRGPRLGVPGARPAVTRGRRAVRRVPGRVLIQAHHAMPWLAPLVLVDRARACPHEATVYGGAGQANPAVCSAPTRSRRSPAARWSRIALYPSCLRVVSQRVALARQTGGRSTARPDCVLSCPRLAVRCPPGSDDPRAGGRGCALPGAGRGRHHPGRDRLEALNRHGRRAGGPPTRVAPCLGVGRGSNVVSLGMTRP